MTRPPTVHQPTPAPRFEEPFLPDPEYGRAIQAMIIAAADIVPIDRQRELIYLAKRRSAPGIGLWWIGGRRYPGETPAQSARRCFHRETRLNLPTERFQFVLTAEHIWPNRRQAPQNVPCHFSTSTFVVELSYRQLRQAESNLDEHEYDRDAGLQAYNRTELMQTQVHPAIIELYDAVFPPRWRWWRRLLGCMS